VFGLLLLAWFGVMAAAATMALQKKKEAPAPSDESSDEIELTAIFESVDFKSTATAFRGGHLDFRFGGGSVDLRGATLDPAGAVLHTNAIFGGGQILVPETWVVETRVTGVGGVGDARPSAPDSATDGAPTLVIDGTVAFGGFGIMSTDPRPEAHETKVVAV
jgi:hypothetical protein